MTPCRQRDHGFILPTPSSITRELSQSLKNYSCNKLLFAGISIPCSIKPIRYMLIGILATVFTVNAEPNIKSINTLKSSSDQPRVISGIDLVTGQLLNISTPRLGTSNHFTLQAPETFPTKSNQWVNPPSNVGTAIKGGYQITEVLVPDLNSSISPIIDYSAAIRNIKEQQIKQQQQPIKNKSDNDDSTTPVAASSLLETAGFSDTKPVCQIVTAETPQLRFDTKYSSDLIQTLQLEVFCPKGVSYQVRPLHRQRLIDSTRIAYRNGDRLFPARLDMRLIDGRPLSQVKFEGNDEVQTILIRASVIANPMPESGVIDTLGPLALMLIDLTKQA